MKGRLWIIPIVTLVLLASLIGCAEPEAPAPAPSPAPAPKPSPAPAPAPAPKETAKHGGTLIRVCGAGPQAPIGYPPETDGIGMSHAWPCSFDGLILMDNKGNQSPKLATKWEVAPDKKSITITLRQGVKFHDETDFNARAAKWAMDQYMAAVPSILWSSVDVIDDYTIRLNLKHWENSVWDTLMLRLYISPTAVEKNGLDWARWNPVGTGPFKFVKFERDVTLEYTRFDDYWDDDLPYLDGVITNYVVDPATRDAVLLSGQAHVGMFIGLKTTAEWRDSGKFVTGAHIYGGTQGACGLVPDSKNPNSPFAKKEVRLAVEYALDKEAICNACGFGFWFPAYQVGMKDALSYDPNLEPRKHDLAKAKQLMKDAGYENGFNCRIIGSPGLPPQDAVVAVQGQLAEIGIIATVEFPDMGKFLSYSMNGWDNALLFGMISRANPNLAADIPYYLSQTASQFVSVQIPDSYQAAIDAALQTVEVERTKLQVMAKELYDNQTIIPVFFPCQGDLLVDGLHDYGFHTLADFSYTPEICWIEESARIK